MSDGHGIGSNPTRSLYNWDDHEHFSNSWEEPQQQQQQHDFEEEEDDPQNPFLRMMRGNTIMFIWVTVILIISILCIAFLIWYYLHQRRRSSARWDRNRDDAVAALQRRRDAAITAQQQKELNDEAKKWALDRNRKILSKVTMIVEDSHLDHNYEHYQDLEALEAGDTLDGDLVLKIADPRQTTGHCAICLGEYIPGNKVIWSLNRDCLHVFHDECILSWLSEGNKNCPCCRLYFIPEEYVGEDDEEPNMSTSDTDSDSFVEEDSNSNSTPSDDGSDEEGEGEAEER